MTNRRARWVMLQHLASPYRRCDEARWRVPPDDRESSVITFIAHLRVPPENAPAFEELLTYVRRMTHEHEPGVVYYEFARSVDEPDTYVVVEVYSDAQVQAAHMATAWVTQSLPQSMRLIEGKPHIRQYVSEGSTPVRSQVKF